MTEPTAFPDDAFEQRLADALRDYASDGVPTADASAVAHAMLAARARRRTRIGLAAGSAALAAAVLAGIAVGGLGPTPRPAGTSPSEPDRSTAVEPTASSVTTSSGLPVPAASTLVGRVAPEACGFPEGAALSFAGRSTTATLDVQQVVGDPLSDDPADIYITRDKYDRGALRARLVCAIYPDPGGAPPFVEVTLHPEDGGRISPTPEPSFTPPPDGISEEDALGIADELLPATDGWEIVTVESGAIGQVAPHISDAEWAEGVSADRWVWLVFLVRGDEATEFVIDYVDGAIIGTVDYIVD